MFYGAWGNQAPTGAFTESTIQGDRIVVDDFNQVDNELISNFDASRSSSVYGNSIKVQPRGFQALIIIKN